MKDKERNITTVSEENIYLLNGRVPLGKAIPFGLQHVLAMFVANLAPVLIVCSAALVRGTGDHLTAVEITRLLQCAMFVAGIGTCLQLYPIWKIGSKLPIVMGVSFTFLGSLLMICTNPDLGYEGMVGAVILGGIFEGVVGLSAQYWKKYLTPVVSSCVVIAIGLSLLPVGMNSWGGGSGSRIIWILVSPSCRSCDTDCLSGFKIFTAWCIQKPEHPCWINLRLYPFRNLYCCWYCSNDRFLRNQQNNQ